jgi:protein transport protein SEC31
MGGYSQPSLDLASFDPARPAHDMDVNASVKASSNFNSLAWGNIGVEGPYPYGLIAGGLQDGVVSLWNPQAIASSRGANPGLVCSQQVHQGAVNCVEFNPIKPTIVATCGSDSEVNIVNLADPTKMETFKPSTGASKHAGSDVLCCAWNRKVQHILCSCSNSGSTIVWDLKKKQEVICFKDPANRARCSAVAWHPDVPTQLIVCYDDERNPSMQMWDLRNAQYPFKEAQGHTKGILDIEWNAMDPNLLLTCGRDSKIICWCLSSGSLETFGELPMPGQQGNYQARWSPHRPSIFAASSISGAVNIHSMQTQQNPAVKYCPKWYGKQGGVSFGFGAKMLSFGAKKVAPVEGQAQPAKSTASWCHSLVVPNEPEIVPTADLFERWIAERKLREFCNDRTQRCGGPAQHEGLMWELMGTQFDGDSGRNRVPALLGFDSATIEQEAERFLGKRPGTTLMAPPEQAEPAAPAAQAAPPPMPAFDLSQAEDFFNDLAEDQVAKQQALEREEQQRKEMIEAANNNKPKEGSKLDWSAGPEALIKKSLLVGNLPAAVECCFKSGRMAEGLLLASGGGTELWMRAKDEYLRLQGDPFLSAMGRIMTNEFDKLVASSNLTNWKETLAILATYSGNQYQHLCLQLATRLEKEAFDIRSAAICYISAGSFSETARIWSQTNLASKGSKNLALQDLVEKMAVFQEATKFNEADPLFNAKLTQYAEILANSGRLTAAMRYLCLLRDDPSSSILRERIYNSAPVQMNQMFGGRPPAFPFPTTDIRILYTPPQMAPAPAPAHGHMAAAPGRPAPGGPAHPGARPAAPGMPGPGPNPGMSGMPRPGMPGPGHGPAPGMPGPGHGPAPGMPGPGHGPAPGMPGQHGVAPPGGGHHGPGGGVAPPGPGLPPKPNVGAMGPSMGCGGGTPAHGMPAPSPVIQQPAYNPTAPPQASAHVLPPGGGMSPGHVAANPAPANVGGPPMPGGRTSTAPQHSAMPVAEGLPVAWPLPTKTQQNLSTTTSVAAQNKAIQEMSAGGAPAIGDPMNAQDLANVRSTLGMLLDLSSQDGNARKRDAAAKSLEELYGKLQAGGVKNTAQQKLMALIKAVEAQDYPGAMRIHQELSSVDWEMNKGWLMSVRRLIPTR